MQNFTETFNEQFKQLVDVQTKSLEPMRIFASLTTDVAEKLARQNYAVAGDVLDFAAKSAQLPMSGDEVQELMSAQAAEVSTFTETMNSRATEYADIAKQFSAEATEATEAATAAFK